MTALSEVLSTPPPDHLALYDTARIRAVGASQAGNWAEASRWWERAWRVSGRQALPGLYLASALMRVGDPRALRLLEAGLQQGPTFSAAIALVAALRQAGEYREAGLLLSRLLACMAVECIQAVHGLADPLAALMGRAGWLGWGQGRLLLGAAAGQSLSPDRVTLRLGRQPVHVAWREEAAGFWSAAYDIVPFACGRNLVSIPALLGTPLRLGEVAAVEGVVERTAHGVRGWAWHPNDPSRPPLLRVEVGASEDCRSIDVVADRFCPVRAPASLNHRWGFEIPLSCSAGSVRVRAGVSGRDLIGSPARRVDKSLRSGQTGTSASGRGTAIILAVMPGEATEAAERLGDFLALSPSRLIIVQCGNAKSTRLERFVDDSSSKTGLGIDLLRVASCDYAAAWNRAAKRADNCDLLVAHLAVHLWPDALSQLRRAAKSSSMAVPLTNGSAVGGYPCDRGPTPMTFDEAEAVALAARMASVTPARVRPMQIDLNGPLFVRRECFDAAGGFREGSFATSRAIIADFEHRAAKLGFSIVLASTSFAWDRSAGTPASLLSESVRDRDIAVLAALGSRHPGVRDSSSRPLAGGAGRAVDAIRLLAALRGRATVLLLVHDEGGGIERHVQSRTAALTADGKAVLLLRSQRDDIAFVRLELASMALRNLRFRMPQEWPDLVALLRQSGVAWIEIHHLRRHPSVVRDLPRTLDVPYDVMLHDYALLCPRVTLIDAAGSYCGEPALETCESCAAVYEDTALVARNGVATLRRDTFRLLAQARGVVAPSRDIMERFKHYVPGCAIQLRPWEVVVAPRHRSARRVSVLVCVVGAINHAKGYNVLLDCVRDAANRALPLRFTVVGHTSDDPTLIEAGAFVTGPFHDDERADLIDRQGASLGFLPSIWPEPWCYALSGLLSAGLPTLCFDIGAQAERVWEAGGRAVPLGTTPSEINEHLLRMAAASSVLHSSERHDCFVSDRVGK